MARTHKAPPAPAALADLSREGLLYLFEISGAFVTRRDLARARWHELCREVERTSNAWDAARHAYSAVLLDASDQRTSRAIATGMLKRERAKGRERRAFAAANRASHAATAFYDEHLAVHVSREAQQPIATGAAA